MLFSVPNLRVPVLILASDAAYLVMSESTALYSTLR